jgi:hypothetical protein
VRNQRVEDNAFYPQIRLGTLGENTASDGFCTKRWCDASSPPKTGFRILDANLCFSSHPLRNSNSIVTKGTVALLFVTSEIIRFRVPRLGGQRSRVP